MKKLKKVIAVLAALLIVTRIVLMGVSAAMVGAGVMVGIVAILAAALVASGQYTEAQVDGMSRNEIVWSVKNGIDNGTIDPKKKFPNPDKNTVGTLSTLSLVDAFTNSEVYNNWKDGVDIIDNAIDDWFRDFFDDIHNNKTKVEDVVKPVLKGNFDLHGYGACYYGNFFPSPAYYYCDYIIVSKDYSNYTLVNRHRIFYVNSSSWSDVSGSITYNADTCLGLYGDVRYEDGTKADTDDEYEYPLGETEDGTKVTVDMLNPDANVKLDRVTGEVLDPSTPITPDVVVQNPSDYINIEYYTDPAVIDLLQQILNALDNANVVAPDDTKDIVDEIAVDLDISQELTDYSLPAVIATVFPFCLPFDFVRGMKLFSADPVTPYFEVEIDVPAFLNVPNQKWKFVIDLEKFETLAKITRWLSVISFSYVLIILSTKIVKGAGA